MKGSEYKLTEEQRELVTKNHDLIYSYAHKSNISIDEYYDILAIGLCKAAKVFDEGKGKFSTIAYCCMKNELCKYWETLNKKSCVPDELVVSYDAQDVRDDMDNRQNFLEVLSDSRSYKDIECATMYSELFKRLTEQEKAVMKYIMIGYTQSEIADMIGCKRHNFPMKSIREKFMKYVAN